MNIPGLTLCTTYLPGRFEVASQLRQRYKLYRDTIYHGQQDLYLVIGFYLTGISVCVSLIIDR